MNATEARDALTELLSRTERQIDDLLRETVSAHDRISAITRNVFALNVAEETAKLVNEAILSFNLMIDVDDLASEDVDDHLRKLAVNQQSIAWSIVAGTDRTGFSIAGVELREKARAQAHQDFARHLVRLDGPVPHTTIRRDALSW